MHCISKKTTGWSEFSSPIAYALVCLATARRFVQEVITHELMDMPHFDGVYVPKPPKGKVFSNMRRSAGDSEGVDTPLFSTMMVVSQTDEGMVAGSRPPLDQPTASQSQSSHSKSIPQSLLDKPTSPITQTYQRKQVKKAPSLLVPSPTQPLSPLRENSPLENIQRETNRVSPNPQEVLSKEMEEHMGKKVATTSASTEKNSGNISKTFPMATLNEQSFKGPRCQETKGVDNALARQKASTTKRSHDPSKGGNTPGEGEDKYDYLELMDTMANFNRDVIKQGKDIEELKLVILSQQVQIAKLKKMVTRLVQKKRRKQFELRKRKTGNDAPKRGEINMEEATKEGELDGIKYGGEGETFDVEGEQEAETERESVQTEIKEQAETVKEVITELEIAETLLKAKHDTPKVSSKTKGVVIKEQGEVLKKINVEKKVMSKEKGKAKLVESDQPIKRQKLVESDEALARKIQADIEQEERVQVDKDREMAKALAAELNEAYQQSLTTEIAQKKAATLKKSVVVKTAAKKRQHSKTFLGTQERNKMIIFLKGAVGVRKEMFSKMFFEKIKELYDSEMLKLQGNETARVEMEKRMKESNDFVIQKPFPYEQETPQKKEATLGEAEKVAEEEGAPESSKQKEPSNTDDVNMYMVVMDKVPEPISAEPVGVKPPEVILWDTLTVDGKEYIRLKRKDEKYEVFNTWAKIVRTCSRSDLEEMFEIGMKLYADILKAPEISITKLVMEYLCMMFKPDEVEHVIRNVFKSVNNWTLYETSEVYAVTLDLNHTEYFLVDRVYNHSRLKLHAMLKKKLGCIPDSEMAKYLIQRTINQIEVNAAGTKLVLLNKINAASSELMLEEINDAEHS
ncbi:hypothetical protein L6452_18965 [Arctium lappa]|uniref:Uncharacterized protein n=1 Tax=Arctium lappa TaxID=4217 RepID=A0ACB9B950_ARCLA|nr:hypothetical protein L6452_18965 [Arctium lappa]